MQRYRILIRTVIGMACVFVVAAITFAATHRIWPGQSAPAASLGRESHGMGAEGLAPQPA